jgi:hypothetical protein
LHAQVTARAQEVPQGILNDLVSAVMETGVYEVLSCWHCSSLSVCQPTKMLM